LSATNHDASGKPSLPRAHVDTKLLERRASILSLLRAKGSKRVTELAQELGVSKETIRRDLRVLEDEGVILRKHGRALAAEASSFETTMTQRQNTLLPEKHRIAAAAAEEISTAETIFIDEGYTPSLVAKLVSTDRNRVIVTASLPTAAALMNIPQFTVYLAGGRVRGSTMGCVDHWTTAMIEKFRFDVAIIGANGISIANGLTTPDPSVAIVKETAIRSAQKTVFVGIYKKFGITSFAQFGTLKDLDLIVTDTHMPAHRATRFAVNGPRVLRV